MPRRSLVSTLTTTVIASLLAAVPAAAATTPNTIFSLAGVDRTCFSAPPITRHAGWPVWPFGTPHPIRGSFNEPRGNAAHYGVDVATPNRTRVYAIDTGLVVGLGARRHSITIGDAGHRYVYDHVAIVPGITIGSVVRRHQPLGREVDGYDHVHLSEWTAACGFIDPRRPGGDLYDPANSSAPAIGPLTVFVANRSAWADLRPTTQDPATRTDPATPEQLSALHGRVDLRAAVTVMPMRRTSAFQQLPLAPAAIRAYLAPLNDTRRHLEMQTIFDGSRLLTTTVARRGITLWHVWAWGTWRKSQCYYVPGGVCGMGMVWHVGGAAGVRTARYPDGRYLYCVQAISIDAVRAHRCTAVTIAN